LLFDEIMNDQSPFHEAVSLITIAAFLLGIGCYLAAHNNVPVISPALFWVAVQVYHWLPALASLRGAEIPYLVAAGTVGIAFYILALPFSPLLAGAIGNAMQTRANRMADRLKETREQNAAKQPVGRRYTAK
jgi:hypothetical protein